MFQQALEDMNKSIETTRQNLSQDSNNTQQDFREHAAQMHQEAENNKNEYKLFADGVQKAISHNKTSVIGGPIQRSGTTLVTVKETSVDKHISRADFGKWAEELYVFFDTLDRWAGVSALRKKNYTGSSMFGRKSP